MRYVSVLSLSFEVENIESPLSETDILKLISDNLNGTEDVVLLPELCLDATISEIDDAFLTGIATLARDNKTYILTAVNKKITDTTHSNSAILFDRNGKTAFCYDKMYPYWSEFDRTDSKIIPGKQTVYADTDFGRVSAAICFDANFPELWQELADLDVDIVLFSSAYSAGRQLSAHAINHHYAIVTSTRKPDFAVYDIDGSELTYNRKSREQILISRMQIDIDKVICHHNFNREKITQMLQDHPGKIELEHDYDREEWCVIRSISEISASELCKKYGIEALRDYKRRSKENHYEKER